MWTKWQETNRMTNGTFFAHRVSLTLNTAGPNETGDLRRISVKCTQVCLYS